MAEVQLTIAGRQYAVHCRDGDEARLHLLARMIAERVDKVKQSSPGLTEVRQLLFAGLLLADDLSDAQTAVRNVVPLSDDPAVLAVLESLAERLETIGQGLAAEASAP
ncbi:MAG TPA: cell division protein ZapA [Sphingobium sp.]|nr:cell division protein ZapA [Sphingobium sp.]